MSAIRYWAVFVLGVTAGAAVALMYAPQTGVKTRRQLKRGLDDAADFVKDRADEYGDTATKLYKRASDAVDDYVATASKVTSKVSQKVSEYV